MAAPLGASTFSGSFLNGKMGSFQGFRKYHRKYWTCSDHFGAAVRCQGAGNSKSTTKLGCTRLRLDAEKTTPIIATLHKIRCRYQRLFRRRATATPATPSPTSNNVAGSGTGEDSLVKSTTLPLKVAT